MLLSQGLRVVIIEDYKLKKGIIRTLYDECNVAIVELDNSQVLKVPFDRIAIDDNPKRENDPQQEESKAGDIKSTRVITKEEYKKALDLITDVNKITKKAKGNDSNAIFMLSLNAYVVGMSIHDTIYANTDSIEVSREELTKIILDNTTPTVISNGIDNKIPAEELTNVSLSALVILMSLVKYFFDEAEND